MAPGAIFSVTEPLFPLSSTALAVADLVEVELFAKRTMPSAADPGASLNPPQVNEDDSDDAGATSPTGEVTNDVGAGEDVATLTMTKMARRRKVAMRISGLRRLVSSEWPWRAALIDVPLLKYQFGPVGFDGADAQATTSPTSDGDPKEQGRSQSRPAPSPSLQVR